MIAWLLALALAQTPHAPMRAGQGPLDPASEARAQRLAKNIRCAVCQGMSVADSPSPMAQAMFDTVREQVTQNHSDDEIYAYFVARYGEWILLTPAAHGLNWLVWLLPIGVLLAGFGFIVARSRGQAVPSAAVPPSDGDDSYLQAVREESER